VNWVLSTHPDVGDDVFEAIDYYMSIDPDLAFRFVAEAEAAFAFARQYPRAGRTLYTKYRRVALGRFPYLVCYRIVGSVVRVLAVVHVRRDPKWVEAKLSSRAP